MLNRRSFLGNSVVVGCWGKSVGLVWSRRLVLRRRTRTKQTLSQSSNSATPGKSSGLLASKRCIRLTPSGGNN